ncbi:FAD-dependent monooxygenase [Brevibacterium daeguense]|uniref:FAD-dependent monooxygenase n=1 Tax=Brevibacterium daeguense TaxID=909936 RepID=A0ABP8EII3_9MICO|nr:FAD-dependent oxidoreductase [Brevibacterium daeguense]
MARSVVICGAGIAGLSLAHELVRHRWDVTIVERAPGPREQGYMMDFFGPGYVAAERMGILDRLRELSYDVKALAYVDHRGRTRAGLSYAKFSQALDGRLLSIMRPDLERALRAAVGSGADIRYGRTVSGFSEEGDGVAVELDDGSRRHVDLLVGADGIHSRIRSLLLGTNQLRYLGLHTAAFIFSDPAVHAALGSRFVMTDTVDRVIGLYGLREGRVAAFAAHTSAEQALPDDPRAALLDRYAGLGWVIPHALEQCPPNDELYYDQVAQVELPRWHRGHVALLGDSCQAVSLLAGQGASLAVAGAHLLAGHLASAPSVPVALARYERQWRPVVTARQEASRRGAEWFLPLSQARRRQRLLMLRLMNLPGLNRLLAGGLVGRTRLRT